MEKDFFRVKIKMSTSDIKKQAANWAMPTIDREARHIFMHVIYTPPHTPKYDDPGLYLDLHV